MKPFNFMKTTSDFAGPEAKTKDRAPDNPIHSKAVN